MFLFSINTMRPHLKCESVLWNNTVNSGNNSGKLKSFKEASFRTGYRIPLFRVHFYPAECHQLGSRKHTSLSYALKTKATMSECPNTMKVCGICCQFQQQTLFLKHGKDLSCRITKVTEKKNYIHYVNSFSQTL